MKGDINVTPEGETFTAAILKELLQLHQGRGLPGVDVERIGPLLRELASDVTPEPPPEAVTDGGSDAVRLRMALAAKFTELAKKLPEDQRCAIYAAFALSDELAEERTYDKRRAWFAKEVIDRSPRQAERHIKIARERFAELIAADLIAQRARPRFVDDADKWYIERFDALLLLDGRYPEAIESRLIRSRVDGLTELAIALDVPVEAGQPRLDLNLQGVSGGELEVVEATKPTRTQYVIKLPAPLRAGETHEYVTRVQVVDGKPMRDYYVLRPERRCDNFRLRVRFNRDRLPAWVRRVVNEDVHSYNAYAGTPADDERVTVDLSGEATESFTGLRTLYGTGLQWGW